MTAMSSKHYSGQCKATEEEAGLTSDNLSSRSSSNSGGDSDDDNNIPQ